MATHTATFPRDDVEAFKQLTQRVTIAWPTCLLFVACTLIFVYVMVAGLSGDLPLGTAIALNALALYGYFTVAHDASHRSLSGYPRLNESVGGIALYILAPVASLGLFRWLHMQHHRFANSEQDPDMYASNGRWSLPLRWLTFDIHYIYDYIKNRDVSAKQLMADIVLPTSLTAVLLLLAALNGLFLDVVLLWLLPARIAIFFLALTFDFLPHYPHDVTQQDNVYGATSIRYGWEWLLTPLFLGQNYHLVHHLYPHVPFYRYVRIWNARKNFHLSHNPPMVSTLALRPDNKK